MRILVVRLSSLGDVVHAIPGVAALRRGYPDARIDWLVDNRYSELVDLVTVVDRRIGISRRHWKNIPEVVRELRNNRYDVTIDLQGLIKSSFLARMSGAPRVIGFGDSDLRESFAGAFYTDNPQIEWTGHVVEKNLALISKCFKIDRSFWEFPIADVVSESVNAVLNGLGPDKPGSFVVLNIGAAWPSKTWIPERFGDLARFIDRRYGMHSVVTWGTGELSLAEQVVQHSEGSAVLSPIATIRDLVAIIRQASIVVSADTGPLQIAAALKPPIVGIYGPTDPRRNGPWDQKDVIVSHLDRCECRNNRLGSSGVVIRRCLQPVPCMAGISLDEVSQAITDRLG